jgi:hypothetical protein
MKQGARKGKERLKPGKPVNSANKKSRHVTSRHVTSRHATYGSATLCMYGTHGSASASARHGRENQYYYERIHSYSSTGEIYRLKEYIF